MDLASGKNGGWVMRHGFNIELLEGRRLYAGDVGVASVRLQGKTLVIKATYDSKTRPAAAGAERGVDLFVGWKTTDIKKTSVGDLVVQVGDRLTPGSEPETFVFASARVRKIQILGGVVEDDLGYRRAMTVPAGLFGTDAMTLTDLEAPRQPMVIDGKAGNDVLTGGAAKDRLLGGPGRTSLDTVFAEKKDKVKASPVSSVLSSGNPENAIVVE